MKKIFIPLLIALSLSIYPSCGNGGDSTAVGPDGGTYELEDGTSIEIPAGALAEEIEISCSEITLDVTDGWLPAGPAYECSPDGVTFAVAVTLTLPYEPGRVPAGAEESDVVIMGDDDAGDWQSLGGTVDETNHLVSTPISHLSAFSSGTIGCPDQDGDGHEMIECGGDDNDDTDPHVWEGGGSDIVSSEGVTIELPDGTKLEIPAGALDESTLIIRDEVSYDVTDGWLPAGPIYAFGPSDTAFAVPVTFTLPYDPNDFPEGVTEADVVIVGLDEDGDWVNMGGEVDTENNLISIEITSLTTFGVGSWGCPDEDGDGHEMIECGGDDCDDTDAGVWEDCGDVPPAQTDVIIIDHLSTDLNQIPESALNRARHTLHIAYGHTSHGSQLITGMQGLVDFAGDQYQFNTGGTAGALDLWDTPFSGASDLGNPDRTSWADATRNFLDDHPDYNVIIWSWCGQVSSATEDDIDTYLDLMTDLEDDYPDVMFVYMTGHVDGTGLDGNLHLRNEQIRDYCRNNDKILYDFADIEVWDPDGTYFGDKIPNDNCDYDSDDNGTRDGNWAIEWQDAHTEGVDWYDCSSAHSQPLNANLKAYAAWWLWARLAGWDGT